VVTTAAVVMVVVCVVQADSRARDAVDGHGVQVRLGPAPFRGVRAIPVDVEVTSLSGEGRRLDGRCLIYLGASDGAVVLLDGGDVWRLPSQSLVLTTGSSRC
jgi:hypothetical protein